MPVSLSRSGLVGGVGAGLFEQIKLSGKLFDAFVLMVDGAQ